MPRRDSKFKLSHRFEIWQALRECCRGARQISKRWENYKYKPHDFETSRYLTTRRITGNWNETRSFFITTCFTVLPCVTCQFQYSFRLSRHWINAKWIIWEQLLVHGCTISCNKVALRTLLSVCLSVLPSHPFHNVSAIVSSWHFQELFPFTNAMSMQKVKVRGQRSRSQRSKQILSQFWIFRTINPVWIHGWLRNEAHSLK